MAISLSIEIMGVIDDCQYDDGTRHSSVYVQFLMAARDPTSLVAAVKHDDGNGVAQIPSNLSSMTADQICDAMLASEEIYVQDCLRVLSEQFENRLRCHNALNCSILSDVEIDSIFSNITGIYVVNHRLYRDLLAARLSGNLPEQFGKIMTQMIPYFKLYANYINKQKAAVQMLNQLRKRKAKFDEFLSISEKCAGGRPINKIMEGPLFRLPQYIVFLATLLRKLIDGSEAAKEVLNAIHAIHQVADHVSNNLRDDAQRRQVVKFQEKLFKGSVALVTPSRLVLKFGELHKVFQKKSLMHQSKRYLFILFNDMLLYASLKTAVQSAKVKHVLQLKGMSVADLPEKPNFPVHNAFYVNSPVKKLILVAKSAQEKSEWVDAISKAIVNCTTLQSELAGQQIPADEIEFEKMIFKKKYRTVIQKGNGMRERRVQSMFDGGVEYSDSISMRPIPDIVVIHESPREQAVQDQTSAADDDLLNRRSGGIPEIPQNQNNDGDLPEADSDDDAVDNDDTGGKAAVPDALPVPVAPAPPPIDRQISSHRRNSAPERAVNRRSASASGPPPVVAPRQFLDEIRAGKELRKVEPVATNRPRLSEFESDLHAQLQFSLERYRKFVQHDDDDLSDSRSWD